MPDRPDESALTGNRLRVIAALEREDPEALRTLLEHLYPTLKDVLGGAGGVNSSVSSAFVQAGMLDSARQRLPMTRNQGPLSLVFDGQIAIADGRTARGLKLLRRVVSEATREPDSWVRRRASSSLADFWMRRGNYLETITLLETATQAGSLRLRSCCLNFCTSANDSPRPIDMWDVYPKPKP